MQSSNTIKELTLALCQFQSAQLKAVKASNNPHFKTKYSGINEVLDAVLPTLTECGLCFVQFPDGEALTTRLMHVSGEWMEASYTLKPAQSTPQGSGSAITYARRYALLAVLGLGTDDDDGNAASTPARPAYTAADRDHHAARLEAARSKIELREAYDAIQPAELKALLKPVSVNVAARIEAAIAEAANSPVA